MRNTIQQSPVNLIFVNFCQLTFLTCSKYTGEKKIQRMMEGRNEKGVRGQPQGKRINKLQTSTYQRKELNRNSKLKNVNVFTLNMK